MDQTTKDQILKNLDEVRRGIQNNGISRSARDQRDHLSSLQRALHQASALIEKEKELLNLKIRAESDDAWGAFARTRLPMQAPSSDDAEMRMASEGAPAL